MKKLFKFVTLVLILVSQTNVSSKDLKREVVFEQLKNDLWTLGLNFEYAEGTRFAVPVNTEAPESMSLPEEISKVLEI